MRRELWHELKRRGFTPTDDSEDWADLNVGADGVLSVPRCKVRVAWDDGTAIVYVMTGNNVPIWDVKLSDNTPMAIIATVIDLAIARAAAMGVNANT